MTSRRRIMPASLLAAALALAACGGSTESGSGDSIETDDPVDTEVAPVETEPAPVETEPAPVETEPAPVETEPASVETEPAPVETEPAPVETEPAPVETEPAPAEGDASCLIGDWVVTEAELNGYYDAVEASFGAEGAGVTFDIVGQAPLSFTATEYTYIGDFSLTLGVAGTEGTGVASGTVSGEYTVVEDLIEAQITSSDLDVVVEVGGVTFSGSELANGILNTAPINRAPFDCAGPTIGFALGDPEDPSAPRHDVLLTPA